jgi:hypothetical protein
MQDGASRNMMLYRWHLFRPFQGPESLFYKTLKGRERITVRYFVTSVTRNLEDEITNILNLGPLVPLASTTSFTLSVSGT